MHLPIVSTSSHYRFQSRFVFPIINETWEHFLTKNIMTAQGEDVILLGDGRMDSPGFSAKYCTYICRHVSRDKGHSFP